MPADGRTRADFEKDDGSIDVLVVDDSAVVREVLFKLLRNVPGMRVEVAADPIIAFEKMEERRPDVILLDLTMPRMDGFAFLEELMAQDPIPVVVISGTAPEGSERAMRALDLGAVELIAKPTLDVAGFFHRSAGDLASTVRSAAAVRVKRRGLLSRQQVRPFGQPGSSIRRNPPSAAVSPSFGGSELLVAIGASTGGPEGLRVVLEGLNARNVGIVIAQHMPAGFTAAFARRLDHASNLSVREAVDGELVTCGQALLAPGDRHIQVTGAPGNFRVSLRARREGDSDCPNVDQLFSSVARCAGAKAIGVLLSGMGVDGARGLSEMKAAGARTVAESEESCAVFGMPRQAIELGIVDHVSSKHEIAGILANFSRSA